MKHPIPTPIKLVNIHKLKIFAFLFVAMAEADLSAQIWSLQACIDTAMDQSRNLKIAENSISIADQKWKEAAANLLPRVSIVSDLRYFSELPSQLMPMSVFGGQEGVYKQVQFGVPYNIGANLQISLPLYNQQIFNGIKAASLAHEASKLQYRKNLEQMVYDITVLYYNIQIASHQMMNIDSNIVNSALLLDKTLLLNSQGLAKESDADRIKLQISQLKTQRKIAETGLDQLYSALKFAMGVPSGTELKVNTEIINNGPSQFSESQTTDYKLAALQVKFADRELKSARRSILPVISAYSTYGQTGFGYSGKPENFLDFYPVSFSGVQFSLPVFSGTASKRKINQKKYESDNAKIRLEQVRDMNSMQIATTRNKLQSYAMMINTTFEQVSLASKVYRQALIQHELGTASLTEVLLADSSLREAQQSHLASITEYLKAELEYKRATGNLINPQNK